MKNKYNSRNGIFRKAKSGFTFNDQFVEVEVMTLPKPGDQHMLITDWNGIIVLFPVNLLKANDLVVQHGRMKISQSLYDTWFKDKLTEEINELSKKIFDQFEKIVQHSDIILHNEDYSNIRFPLLKSTILYNTELHYTLGSILNSWMQTDDLSVASGSYMLKLNVSPLSGINNYTAYSARKKCLVKGTLSEGDKCWIEYMGKYQALVSTKKNKSDLLTMMRLIDELNID